MTPLPSSSSGRPRALVLSGALVLGALFPLHSGCGGGTTPGTPPPSPEDKQIHIQLLAFNDFHGNLEAPTGSNGRVPTTADGSTTVDAGGAAYLAQHIQDLRAQNPNTLVVAAGDLIGASPLVSGIFHDEPTIKVMNQIGLDLTSVGNHEFDEGREELLRMQNGGCHPKDHCQFDKPFPGAKFQYLSANVYDSLTRKTLLPAYSIKTFEGVKVAFIGMTLKGTGAIVDPIGVENLTFQDEADTVNALVPELKAQGVETIVVLIHEGGYPTVVLPDDCQGVSGAIVDINHRIDKAVDLIISGHTHEPYNCVLEGRRVTSAFSYGRVITQVDLVVSSTSHDAVSVDAKNIIVTRDTAEPTVDAIVKDAVIRAGPKANQVIGNTTGDLKAPVRTVLPAGVSGESTLGDVVADGMLEYTSAADKGAAVIAFINSGGVRADLLAGDITYGKAYNVQPFSNNITTLTLTGAQIHDLLEQQFVTSPPKVLQPSRGFSYSWSASAAAGKKVDPASIKLNGTVLDAAAKYRVTEINFLAAGGDNFTPFTLGTNLLTGPIDLDVLSAYLQAHNPISPPKQERITAVP